MESTDCTKEIKLASGKIDLDPSLIPVPNAITAFKMPNFLEMENLGRTLLSGPVGNMYEILLITLMTRVNDATIAAICHNKFARFSEILRECDPLFPFAINSLLDIILHCAILSNARKSCVAKSKEIDGYLIGIRDVAERLIEEEKKYIDDKVKELFANDLAILLGEINNCAEFTTSYMIKRDALQELFRNNI